MRAEHEAMTEPRRGPRRALRRSVALGCGAVLLAGCASMPDSGENRPVDAARGVDSQVRVFAVPPPDKAQPSEIVEGFLEAMTSDDPKLATARQYLTEEAAQKWEPGSGITVLSSGLSGPREITPARGPEKELIGRQFELVGTKLATVDGRGAYQPAARGGRYETRLQLVKKDGQWRIANLPDGLVLGESDFQRIFKSVNKYYFASGMLVADPVYVRQRQDPESRMDPMTQTVKSLLEGPSSWLGPVVTSSFPTGTALKEGTRTLTSDENNTLQVPLNKKAANVAAKQCEKMGTQLLFTARELTSSRIAQVELLRADGTQLCKVTEASAQTNRLSGAPQHQYYVDNDHRLVRMQLNPDSAESPDAQRPAEQVPGPLVGSGLKVGTAGVAHDERRAAVVTENGHALYVLSLTTGGPVGQPALKSAANQLSAPSWDALGDLWVADRNPADPALWLLPGGTGTPRKVDVAGLDGGRIESLRVSSDGVRIALLIKKDDRETLHVGRIERPEGKGDAGTVTVRELRAAAPQMEEVKAVSWASRGRLLVVGREAGGLVQARYMQADGSVVVSGSLAGASGVSAIAASEDERLPVVAFSDEGGIVWLPPGAQWRTVTVPGRAPVYPG
ncbi:LpqB family beta-propeller domain-containing protein [Streptomyces bambusae]|uniref:LpqB family beta-propeller domain-containing protein n=1 Tax=Streptomyces bambusae TaxID=1550616 RepID=UPI001CFFB0B4|nr:LpqB family beta-propeller domain-containing protein [Streptomyces bambusae]MCB5169430.1 LpqB family beta-propeller domain-containing protein [Streptomyces bambusae]